MVQDRPSKYRQSYIVDFFVLFFISFLLNAYDLAGNFDFVIFDPRVRYAPDARAGSVFRWSFALRRRFRSYCCDVAKYSMVLRNSKVYP